MQLERCEEIVRAFDVACFKQPRVEADDLIASAVRLGREQGLRTVIVAADKDLMQLVGPDVMLWDTMRDRVMGPPEVAERFGVEVAQLGDLLALMGDSSDNIPGVPHVGPKTARELLVEYKTLEGIYANTALIKRKALRETLETNRDLAFLSRRLVALKDDCPLTLTRETLAWHGRNLPSLKRIYAELGFQRQLSQLETEAGTASAAGTRAEAAPVVTSVTPLSVEYELVTERSVLGNASRRRRERRDGLALDVGARAAVGAGAQGRDWTRLLSTPCHYRPRKQMRGGGSGTTAYRRKEGAFIQGRDGETVVV